MPYSTREIKYPKTAEISWRTWLSCISVPPHSIKYFSKAKVLCQSVLLYWDQHLLLSCWIFGRWGQSDMTVVTCYYENIHFIIITTSSSSMKNVQALVLFNIHMSVLQIHSSQVENSINLLRPYHSILPLQWISITRCETGRKLFWIFFPQQKLQQRDFFLLSEQSAGRYLYFMSYFTWLQY